MFNSRFIVCSFFVILGVVSRFLPHPPNFSPLMAIALFSGAHFTYKRDSLWVPLLAWFIGDIFLGFHALQPVIYSLILLMAIAGWLLRGRVKVWSVLGFSLAGSVVFFLVTNFFVWLTSGMYENTFSGLVQSYVMAIPFFHNSLLGDLVFNAVFFGSVYLLEKKFILEPIKAA